MGTATNVDAEGCASTRQQSQREGSLGRQRRDRDMGWLTMAPLRFLLGQNRSIETKRMISMAINKVMISS